MNPLKNGGDSFRPFNGVDFNVNVECRTSNVERDGDRVIFRINGGDSRLVMIAVGVMLLVTLLGIGLASLFIREKLMVPALVTLVGIIPLIFLILRVILSGRFARYRVVFDKSEKTVTALDSRLGKQLFTGPMDPGRFYLAKTRIQIGYVTSLKNVLVYGHPHQDVVEDGVPSERMSLLCISGRTAGLREIIREIIRG